MTHYFFDLMNGSGFTPDEEGTSLPDSESARRTALRAARAILAEEVLRGELDLAGKIIVRNPDGGTVMEIRFDEAVTIKSDGMDQAEAAHA